MIGRRGIFAILVLLLPGAALAQEDPTVNDSDFDTSAPPADESYLDDADGASTDEPGVSDADFDTSVPSADESYLDGDTEQGASSSAGDKGAPGFGLVAALGALGVVALALRRR